MTSTLPKLQTSGLPVLAGSAPTLKDAALWIIALRRWAKTNDFNRWMFPGGDTSSFEDDEKPAYQRDAMRYMHAAIGSSILASDLADNVPQNDCPAAVTPLDDHDPQMQWTSGSHNRQGLLLRIHCGGAM